MDKISLYRRYRPQCFSDLVGQDHVAITIKNAAKTGSISHAYLFAGPRGTGKTSAARIVAKVLNCQHVSEEGEPCLKCDFCRDTREARLIDLIEIDAASNRGIDEIRDIREKIKFLPTHATKKIYIIDEVHMLTKEAFNALLKTLEEPPAHAHFILATTEVYKVPETIISRCQRFDFRRINSEDIVKRLEYIAKEEGLEYEKAALEVIAHNVQGGLRDAISIFEQIITDSAVRFNSAVQILGCGSLGAVKKFCDGLLEKNTADLLLLIEELFREGQDLAQFSKEVIEKLRELMINAANSGNKELVYEIMAMINYFQEAHLKLKDATIPQLNLEIAVINCTVKIESSKNLNENKAILETKTIQPTVINEVKMPKIEEKTEMPFSSMNFNEDAVRENLVRVSEHIKIPIARRSFNEAKIIKIEGNKVFFGLTAKFHFEKVTQTVHKQEIWRAFEEVFGQGKELIFELQDISFESPMDKGKDLSISYEREHRAPDVSTNDPEKLTKTVLEIFGGEEI